MTIKNFEKKLNQIKDAEQVHRLLEQSPKLEKYLNQRLGLTWTNDYKEFDQILTHTNGFTTLEDVGENDYMIYPIFGLKNDIKNSLHVFDKSGSKYSKKMMELVKPIS